MSAVSLTPYELATTALLVVLCAGMSMWLALGIQRSLVVAAARLVLQLAILGYVLRSVFQISVPWLTALAIGAMLLAAAREVGSRQQRRLAGPWHYGIGGGPVALATLCVSMVALTTALRPHPWYDARHAIPLTGIILGTAMNSASLGLNHVFATVTRERAAIEARLCLGASRYTAFHTIIAQSVRAGMLPVMNQMAAAGIITMPGIMTGQILAGMDPLESAKYQILLMFLLTAGGFLATVGSTYLAVWRLTDERDRLRLDRIVSRR
jgi:putative ABC transport system permease protein